MTLRFAVGHSVSDAGIATAEPYGLNRAAYAAGGAIMPVGDMLKYAAFHMGDGANEKGEQVMSGAALAAMRAVQAPKLGTDSAIGLTWHLDDVGDVRTVSHGGATVGQIARLVMVPEHDFALAVVTNANTGRQASSRIVEWALDAYLGARDDEPQRLSLSETELAAYVGLYARPYADIVLSLEAGELFMQQRIKQGFPDRDSPLPEPAPPVKIEFFEKDRIRPVSGYWNAEFVRKSDGTIGWLRRGMRIHARQ